MTTAAAARQYLNDHLKQTSYRKNFVFNPNNKPEEELPVIMGFNNGGSSGWYEALAIAQDGTVLGGHTCSDEGYMRADLGIIEGTRPDRHETSYQIHYPDGYRMAFIESQDIDSCEVLQEAFRLGKQQL